MSGPSSNDEFVVMDARRRRSAEEKRAIVAELLVPGASVSSIARKHNVASSLLFRWRKQFGGKVPGDDAKKNFVPVVVAQPKSCAILSTIEIELKGGRRIKVDHSTDLALLRRVIEALERS